MEQIPYRKIRVDEQTISVELNALSTMVYS